MFGKKFSRREFLKVAGIGSGAAVVLAACGGSTPDPTDAPADDPIQVPAVVGNPFDGKTVRVHAISGANYDELYKLVPSLEEKTGATVEFVFKGNGFETDKRLVQDFAAGTVDYDICWDHSSFFSQYVKVDGLEPLDDYYLWCDHRAKGEAAEITDTGRSEGLEAINWCGGTYSSE